MTYRRFFHVLIAIAAVAASAACIPQTTADEDETQEAGDLTGTAEEATRLAPTPSETPVPPTPSETATLTLHPLIAEALRLTDPQGDVFLCGSGAPVGDPAVDIVTIDVFEPSAFDSDHDGWLLRVGLDGPANLTFADDWSFSVLAIYYAAGSSEPAILINEIHDATRTMGIRDLVNGGAIPGTEHLTYTDDMGSVWFAVPRGITTLQFESYHLASEEQPLDQVACDLAPDGAPYTLDLPGG